MGFVKGQSRSSQVDVHCIRVELIGAFFLHSSKDLLILTACWFLTRRNPNTSPFIVGTKFENVVSICTNWCAEHLSFPRPVLLNFELDNKTGYNIPPRVLHSSPVQPLFTIAHGGDLMEPGCKQANDGASTPIRLRPPPNVWQHDFIRLQCPFKRKSQFWIAEFVWVQEGWWK